MERYKGKTILITGASSGIGEEFAKSLDKLGASLILTARSEDKLLKLASNMHNACVIAGDLSKKEFPKELHEKIKDKGIEIDILINNAGFGYSGKFLDSSMQNYEEMINLNICSLVNLTHLFLKGSQIYPGLHCFILQVSNSKVIKTTNTDPSSAVINF